MPERIEIIVADITTLEVDAIVNAANRALRGGGGVDGAIHRAAGPKLLEACIEIGGCETGEAVITPGFALPARHVIHTVGPIWRGGDAGEERLLAACYRNAFVLARTHDLRSIAYPSISTGAYGFPAARAAEIAVNTLVELLHGDSEMERVIFCCFDEAARDHHARALAATSQGKGG